MTDNELMQRAVQMAQQSSEPLKCGCVIARDGVVIAEAFNSQRQDANATAHDGIKAVALAGQALGQKDLSGCVAYCTHEPCTMCLSAMIYAKVDSLYYAVPLEEVSDTAHRIQISVEELLDKAPREIKTVPGFMKEEVQKELS